MAGAGVAGALRGQGSGRSVLSTVHPGVTKSALAVFSGGWTPATGQKGMVGSKGLPPRTPREQLPASVYLPWEFRPTAHQGTCLFPLVALQGTESGHSGEGRALAGPSTYQTQV